jgi:hypothetical protein
MDNTEAHHVPRRSTLIRRQRQRRQAGPATDADLCQLAAEGWHSDRPYPAKVSRCTRHKSCSACGTESPATKNYMKSLPLILPVLALLVTATASFVACGADTSSGVANGGSSSNAGKGSTSGGAVAGASSAGSSSGGGTASGLSCASADCGPALGIASTTCSDGSVGGLTGRCLRLETGACGWEVRSCPPAGEGGAAAAGGAPASGGATAAGAGDGGAAGAGGAPSSDRCGGCNYNGPVPEICIYQAGGPGPGRFLCATQNPCKAAGVCACIVDQGTCNFMSEGGGPGYCVCENGLK